ncbi:Carbohydrate sulfotransferase 10 [Branchiostoma belcheri]|nr:Carbohydrate sulfotransferase 10 [Branchiostoma belcheri]
MQLNGCCGVLEKLTGYLVTIKVTNLANMMLSGYTNNLLNHWRTTAKKKLASAWFDKFVITPERVGEYAFVNRMRRGLDSLEDRTLIDELSKINEERTDNDPKRVSFREFLFAVSHRIEESQHWLSFDRLCTPCKIDYDFVAHTDTIALDIRLFLKQSNITANEDVLPKHQSRNVNNGNIFKDFYGRVPTDEILPLQKVFQKDFDIANGATTTYGKERILAKPRFVKQTQPIEDGPPNIKMEGNDRQQANKDNITRPTNLENTTTSANVVRTVEPQTSMFASAERLSK